MHCCLIFSLCFCLRGSFLDTSFRSPSGCGLRGLFPFVLLRAFVSFSVGVLLLTFLDSPRFGRSGLLCCFVFPVLFLLGFPRGVSVGSFCVRLRFPSMFQFSFSLGMSAGGGGGVPTRLSPLAVGHRPSSLLSRLRGCPAWCSSALAPSPLGRCVCGDSSHRLAPSHIGACGDSSGPTPSPIGRCAWGDSCDPPLAVLCLASVWVAVPVEVVMIVYIRLSSAATVLLGGSWHLATGPSPSPDLVGRCLWGL